MFSSHITASCLVILSCIAALASGKVQLKVGLYNTIPDLQKDGLKTLKAMVEQGFNNKDHTVNAVVDTAEYTPYPDPAKEKLNAYLTGDFDMIEIDTANLLDVLGNIMDIATVTPMQADTLKTAKNSVTVTGKQYGYPSLVCGNFIVALSPGTAATCPLNDVHWKFSSISQAADTCTENFQPPYERILGGKMSGSSGWYLPSIYLDGYVDRNGPNSVQKAITDVKSGIVDKDVCKDLLWLLSQCQTKGEFSLDTNKCYSTTAPNNYVKDENRVNLKNDIRDKKTLTFFGFSEVSAEILRDTAAKPYGLTSWPFSHDTNSYMLQFTDALVVSKKAWGESKQKQNAIKQFIAYYTGPNLRRKIALGEDLKPQQNRYLLQAIAAFYTSVPQDVMYTSAYDNLEWSVAAPPLSDDDKATMQKELEKALVANCVVAKTEF